MSMSRQKKGNIHADLTHSTLITGKCHLKLMHHPLHFNLTFFQFSLTSIHFCFMHVCILTSCL